MLFGVAALIVAVVRCEQVGGLSAGLQAIGEKTRELNLTPMDHAGLWATVPVSYTHLCCLPLPSIVLYFGCSSAPFISS